MINFVTYENIDFDKWDNCISNCFNSNIYVQSWYLNIVCEKWHALILNDYEAVMPLYERIKWGVPTIRQPLYCQQLGVFSINTNIDVLKFVESIPKKYRYININLNRHNNYSFFKEKKVNHILFLDEDKSRIQNNYSNSTIKNINKALEKGFAISSLVDSSIKFCEHKAKLGKSYMNKRLLVAQEKIIDHCLKNRMGKIFSVSYQNKNCCSIFIMIHNNRLILQSSYTNEIGKKNGAFFLLLDHIIKLEEYNNFTLDFEGSVLKGVAKRNIGFGAKETFYLTLEVRRFPFNLMK